MTKKAAKQYKIYFAAQGDLGEDRTLDPLIKSQLLYRLSYQVVIIFYRGANKRFFFDLAKPLCK